MHGYNRLRFAYPNKAINTDKDALSFFLWLNAKLESTRYRRTKVGHIGMYVPMPVDRKCEVTSRERDYDEH